MRLRPPIFCKKNWVLRPARYLFIRQQRPANEGDEIITAFRDGEVTLRSKRRTEGFTNATQEIGYQGIRKGDLVIHSMDAFAGAIGVSDSDGKASPVVHAYESMPNIDARFYAYLLRDLAKSGYIMSLAKGIRERSTAFDCEMFRSLVLPVPEFTEQKAIADYLDEETAKIDTLIDKKRQQIELLIEHRQALISSALSSELVIPEAAGVGTADEHR